MRKSRRRKGTNQRYKYNVLPSAFGKVGEVHSCKCRAKKVHTQLVGLRWKVPHAGNAEERSRFERSLVYTAIASA